MEQAAAYAPMGQILDTPVPQLVDQLAVSAQLGGHVSSSTLSAHQMPRASEPADSDQWVELHDDVKSKTCYWNRRSNVTVRQPPAGIEVVWVCAQDEGGGVRCWHRRTRVSTCDLPPLPPE